LISSSFDHFSEYLSSYYAMAVIDLAEALAREMQTRP
jgi:hypothetical protein